MDTAREDKRRPRYGANLADDAVGTAADDLTGITYKGLSEQAMEVAVRREGEWGTGEDDSSSEEGSSESGGEECVRVNDWDCRGEAADPSLTQYVC
jgi:hypothetical protein